MAVELIGVVLLMNHVCCCIVLQASIIDLLFEQPTSIKFTLALSFLLYRSLSSRITSWDFIISACFSYFSIWAMCPACCNLPFKASVLLLLLLLLLSSSSSSSSSSSLVTGLFFLVLLLNQW